MQWLPIESAPKEPVRSSDGSHYAARILSVDDSGYVRIVRWWWAEGDDKRWRNFIGDCGNAYRPTHWMPLPDPPTFDEE